jgi:hypothetical protein
VDGGEISVDVVDVRVRRNVCITERLRPVERVDGVVAKVGQFVVSVLTSGCCHLVQHQYVWTVGLLVDVRELSVDSAESPVPGDGLLYVPFENSHGTNLSPWCNNHRGSRASNTRVQDDGSGRGGDDKTGDERPSSIPSYRL